MVPLRAVSRTMAEGATRNGNEAGRALRAGIRAPGQGCRPSPSAAASAAIRQGGSAA